MRIRVAIYTNTVSGEVRMFELGGPQPPLEILTAPWTYRGIATIVLA